MDATFRKLSIQDEHYISPLAASSDVRTLVLASDRKFFKYLGVTLLSLAEHGRKDVVYDIVILSAGLTEYDISQLRTILPENFVCRCYDVKEILQEYLRGIQLKTYSNWPIEMYYRMLIPLLMPEYERVIYCDCDMIFLDNLEELYTSDLGGHEFGAVRTTPWEPVDTRLPLENPKDRFNSGVVIFSPKMISQADYLERLKKALQYPKLQAPDQDALNLMYDRHVKLFPWSFNFRYHIIFDVKDVPVVKNPDNEILKQVKVIHYTTPVKPWFYPDLPLAEHWWRFARQTPWYPIFQKELAIHATLEVAKIKRDLPGEYLKLRRRRWLTRLMPWKAEKYAFRIQQAQARIAEWERILKLHLGE